MAEEMKTTPAPEEQRPEPPAPETPDAPAPLRPEALTVEEQLILEHEGRAALFEMGEVFPDVPEFPGVATLEPPAPEQGSQVVLPGMEGPPPPENKVGQRIKEARKKVGLTQKELADRIEVSTTTIQQYELGKRQPRFEQMAAIADALGVTYYYLVTGKFVKQEPTGWASRLDERLRCITCSLESEKPSWFTPNNENKKDSKFIHFWGEGHLEVTDEILKNLDDSIDDYVRFKLYELKYMHKDKFIPYPAEDN